MPIPCKMNPMGTMAGGLLPPGYILLPDGLVNNSAMINTGVRGDSKTDFSLEFVTLTSANDRFCGAQSINPLVRYHVTNIPELWVGPGNIKYVFGAGAGVGRHSLYASASGGVCVYDGISQSVTKYDFDTGVNFHLWSYGTVPATTQAVIISAKLWRNGEMMRDMVAALDPNGVGCMYDLVTRTAYYPPTGSLEKYVP